MLWLLALLAAASAHECFNCAAGGHCLHFSECNEFTGLCECPAGFGSANCSVPQCGSLAGGANRPLRDYNASCECSDGWSGINCNMCDNDAACRPFMPLGSSADARCFTGGELVAQNFHMCDVTNRKIADTLAGRRAQVTFGCTRANATCDLQLWVDEVESFFCKFSECDFNGLDYECASISCECQPGELLCGKEGSIDLSVWLEKSVQGPGSLRCDEEMHCTFEEPEMNKLIKYVFGDASIELACAATECLHYSQVPGYEEPANGGAPLLFIVLSLLLAAGVVALVLFLLRRANAPVELPPALAAEEPVAAVQPLGLYFSNVGYHVDDKDILSNVSGAVPPARVLAIMGGSGAGKSTLLDILAGKHKQGAVRGHVFLNGQKLESGSEIARLVGFVDQTDAILVPTLTVYEHVLFSARLRLPRSMADAAVRLRVHDTLRELGIADLAARRVGAGLSGGERRRVCIACELVTSPSVLLLDEPTSGLDAFSAHSVVETLINLSQSASRTIVFTIHQPRANIVALFDRILLLAQGRVVYTGPCSDAPDYFASVGYACPKDTNFADYIVDLSMRAGEKAHAAQEASLYTDDPIADIEADESFGSAGGADALSEPLRAANDILSDDDGCDMGVHTDPLHVDPAREWRDFASHARVSQRIPHASIRAMASSQPALDEPQESGVDALVAAFRRSRYFRQVQTEVDGAARSNTLPAVAPGAARARFGTQFRELSVRLFRNLYRDPMLVLTHYGIAAAIGVLCGYLYFRVGNDIPGFQNRLGLFFFLLAVFGFSSLTTISLFAIERPIFVRERANGYYHPLAYYLAKVLLDIVPLRLGPPLVLALVVYPLVSLNTSDFAPFIFLLVLLLFNFTCAMLMLLVGILVEDLGVASLTGSMINLFGILFAGLFLNQESMPKGSGWAKSLSVYHYAYEALSVNEVKYLTLVEDKFGLKIEVPGSAILSAFGFDNGAVARDILSLAVVAFVTLIVGYVVLYKVLIERR